MKTSERKSVHEPFANSDYFAPNQKFPPRQKDSRDYRFHQKQKAVRQATMLSRRAADYEL